MSSPKQVPAALKTVELLLLGLVLVFALGFTVTKLVPPDTKAPPRTGDEAMLRLEATWEAGGGRALATAGALLGMAALAALGMLGPRMVRSLRAALQEKRPLPRISFPHVLLAYGGVFVVAGMIAATLPRTTLKTTDGRELPLQVPGGLVLDEGAAKVTLTWGLGEGRLEHAGPAAVDSKALVRVGDRPVAAGSSAVLLPGEEVAVGALEGTLKAPAASNTLGRFLLGQSLALLALLGVVFVIGGKKLLAEIGLTAEGFRDEVLRGGLAWLAFLPVFVATMALTTWLGSLIGVPTESHSMIQMVERDASLGLLVFLLAGVLAPLTEELIFRGMAVPGCERVLGNWGAWLVPAFLFSSVHAGFSSLLPMLALGLLFGGLRLTSPRGSIVGAITAHALHNGFTLALLFAILAGC